MTVCEDDTISSNAGDPRITPIGHFSGERRRGCRSPECPRRHNAWRSAAPIRFAHNEHYRQAGRRYMLPTSATGTGLAQVNGLRGDASVDKMFQRVRSTSNTSELFLPGHADLIRTVAIALRDQIAF